MVHFVDYMAQVDPDKIEYFSKLIESKRKISPGNNPMKNLIKTQHGKALLYFTLIVFINLIILSIIIIGIGLGIKGYISDTKFAYEAVTCCGSICSKCFFTLRTFLTILPWGCVVILFIGIGMATRKTILMLSWNYRFIRPITPYPPKLILN